MYYVFHLAFLYPSLSYLALKNKKQTFCLVRLKLILKYSFSMYISLWGGAQAKSKGSADIQAAQGYWGKCISYNILYKDRSNYSIYWSY